MKIKTMDIISIIIVLVIIVIYILNTINVGNDSKYINVQVEGKEYIFPLDKDETYSFTGPIGKTVVEVKNSEVAIVESECDNQTCIKMGHIHHAGQSVACLPNRILVTVTGDNREEVDAVSF